MYHLFGYDRYYPNGGMSDYCGSFNTIEKAKSYVADVGYCDHFEIVTWKDNELVVIERGSGIWEDVGRWTVEWEK